ncbi:assimilatory sulfite reductase [Hymenopellis radicata]|nr:assimilatory sulfite reductase [Hymenopellis radicata]
MMAPALSYLPRATPTSRLVLQVSNLLFTEDTLSASLYPLTNALPILPKDIVILLSATPQQVVDFAQLSYKFTDQHVIHIFDHYGAAREVGHSVAPLLDTPAKSDAVVDIVKAYGYSFFSYAGDAEAQDVVVLLNSPLALAAQAFAKRTTGFGVVTVNVLRPWDEESLLAVIPPTVQNVHVLDDVASSANHGVLYGEVFGTFLSTPKLPSVHSHRVTPADTNAYLLKQDAFTSFLSSLAPAASSIESLLPASTKRLLLFSTPKTSLTTLPHVLEDLFLSNKGISASLVTDHDAFSKAGGVTANRLLLSLKKEESSYVPVPVAIPYDVTTGAVDFIAILDQSLLKSHSLFKYAKQGAVVLVASSWSVDEVVANLPTETKEIIAQKALTLFTIDASNLAAQLVGDDEYKKGVIENVIVNLAFLRLYIGQAAQESVLLKVASIAFDDIIQGVSLEQANAAAWNGLVDIDVAQSDDEPKSAALKTFDFNAIIVEGEDGDSVATGARVGNWHDAAKHLMFPDAFTPDSGVQNDDLEFPLNPALRPELPEDTFLVTCTVNRRLTPLEYDRNVFHLEFDTSGTGLKYDIGEALGIHGWNDEKEVLDFCSWYGVDPDRLITIPVAAGDEETLHTRTVFQALQQQIDLFGHPPKSFYTDLAPFASSSVDKHALLFIGSPEGVATFKKLSEKDTVTFADVLKMYSSARPGIETLCQLVGDIKPRHYSIASAQAVVGNRVDLLVVTVDWVTPSGTPRYGQCTRYLAGLRVGQKVTVSIKPSVMKLPPDNMQPLIMAGLGTGAAPFRAFLQHRAWSQQNGEKVGPVYYYFGSRHQSQEYLYGEEIEAFISDNVITRAGLAFSRDGPKKVYIQHKMLEDSEALAEMLQDQKGVFYLCGPTWPVPDVYEALVNALVKYKGYDAVSAGAYVESLKEEERYILEVY